MVDEYVLTTSRESLIGGDRGTYRTELTYNGKKVDFELSDYLRDIIDRQGLRHIEILANSSDFDSLEFKLSARNLRS